MHNFMGNCRIVSHVSSVFVAYFKQEQKCQHVMCNPPWGWKTAFSCASVLASFVVLDWKILLINIWSGEAINLDFCLGSNCIK